ncbi:uncharacterized [Tachysurus ichikawai]
METGMDFRPYVVHLYKARTVARSHLCPPRQPIRRGVGVVTAQILRRRREDHPRRLAFKPSARTWVRSRDLSHNAFTERARTPTVTCCH